jgi:hypothetical protein
MLCTRATFHGPVGNQLSYPDSFDFFRYEVKMTSSTTFMATILNHILWIWQHNKFIVWKTDESKKFVIKAYQLRPV